MKSHVLLTSSGENYFKNPKH